ncbi:hypothetical protein GCM10007276_10850 [Agaricicola taiwanensis]|uniref:Uncharacterized protein n=1 Tax=Agaricicola taiwanensis TaxID=591372 RepID=A0A8J2VKW2_9RHOB|nr:hypothetical protein [Agaricicola taiwanensis]GGE35168.1 hypothetical protein GCM10007276_10850 [Agaricicola taiwanensis]
MTTHPPKTIGLLFQPIYRYWQLALARQLKERYGATIHGYCATDQEVTFYRENAGDLLASIKNIETDFRHPEAVKDEAALYARARHWEGILGCTFGLLTVSNRHYGRGYSLAGTGHPRSRMSEQGRTADVIAGYVASAEAWDHEFRTRGFDLVINGTPVTARLARHYGVPYRTMLNSRIEDLFYWADDEFYWSSRVEPAWKALRAGGERREPVVITRTHNVIEAYRERFKKDTSILRLARRLGYLTLQRGWHHWKGYEKARGYYLSENLKYVTREWIDARRMTGRETAKLDSLRGKPFVFFPLHTEPESSVGQMSPEFFFQHAAIAALARDLPAGITLAVKENIAGVGRRPRDFYRAVADLKNVVWLDMMEYGLEVVREAKAVATITGTAGMEAAIMGIPVITFGLHNNYNFLPHVHVAESLKDLSPLLADIIAERYDRDRAQQDGALFQEAVRMTSFSMGSYNYKNLKNFDLSMVEAGLQALLGSLEPAAPAVAPA